MGRVDLQRSVASCICPCTETGRRPRARTTARSGRGSFSWTDCCASIWRKDWTVAERVHREPGGSSTPEDSPSSNVSHDNPAQTQPWMLRARHVTAFRDPVLFPLLLAATLHGTASAQIPDTLPPDPARDAYLDETARRLMLGAKAARDTARLAIDAYTALIRERMSFEACPPYGATARGCTASAWLRIRWSREEPDVAHVLGAPASNGPGTVTGDASEFFRRGCGQSASPPIRWATPSPSASRSSSSRTGCRKSPSRSPLEVRLGAPLPVPFGRHDLRTARATAARVASGFAVTVDPAIPEHPPRLGDHVDRPGVFRGRSRRLPAGQEDRQGDVLPGSGVVEREAESWTSARWILPDSALA